LPNWFYYFECRCGWWFVLTNDGMHVGGRVGCILLSVLGLHDIGR